MGQQLPDPNPDKAGLARGPAGATGNDTTIKPLRCVATFLGKYCRCVKSVRLHV